jgi:AcrR family transcriptional regulator
VFLAERREVRERRRGAALESALLDAAWAELAQKGYAKFTMDAVAIRAGTSPPVLYRRWSDKHELLRATLSHAAHIDDLELADTGSLRSDVLALMRLVNDTRGGLTAMISVHLGGYYQEIGSSPLDFRDQLLPEHPLADSIETIYQRAADRGEVDTERLTERIKTLPFDLLRNEIVMTLRHVPDSVIEEIVDTIFLPHVQRPSCCSCSGAI